MATVMSEVETLLTETCCWKEAFPGLHGELQQSAAEED